MRIRRKCVLCDVVIDHMSRHVSRKHAGMSTLERTEYKEKMLRETPIQWIAKEAQKKKPILLKCPLCFSLGIRIDGHLLSKHSIKRGSRKMKTLLARAKKQARRLANQEKSQQQQQQRSRVEVTEPEQEVRSKQQQRSRVEVTKPEQEVRSQQQQRSRVEVTEPEQEVRSQQQQQRSRVQVTEPEQEVRGRVDTNLKFTDESHAYAAYCSRVTFTTSPKAASTRVDNSSSTYDLHPVSGAGETLDDPPHVQRTTKQIQQSGATSAPRINKSTFLDNLLNVVDRYWNGSKSLHAHSKFQAEAQSLLEKLLTHHSATSQEHIDRLQLENVSLLTKLGQQATEATGLELQRSLDISQRDVDQLCVIELQTEENKQQLQVQLQEARRKAAADASHGDIEESVQGQEKLLQENEKLKVQLKHATQLQELATVLKESHKSLVATNDHLLKDLEETKQRHIEEVKLLHWSYNQLKQTMDITMPPTYAPSQTITTTTHQPQGGAVNGYGRGEGSPSMQPGCGSYSHEFEKYLKR
ncbi:uncharacterized protein LOC115920190 [Strongylocentrotus purpuratus]|uniref:Uncharacterized protein n=1 Tax=Strongylocentrotus purpuratus TaxID=7668 RepID=A0A7M7SU19_STRPU|nr:uncharacterized protein LOC115920190 [Strongylocentrotus purpuratus]